jgi:hypothetical protein
LRDRARRAARRLHPAGDAELDADPAAAPDDPTPAGIAYLCEGRKEVAVVYAKNRASVTFGDKTWRTEYQPTGGGFRYVDTSDRMGRPRRLAALRESGTASRSPSTAGRARTT